MLSVVDVQSVRFGLIVPCIKCAERPEKVLEMEFQAEGLVALIVSIMYSEDIKQKKGCAK
ncbi:hypothetical protein SDC9_52625 [bioreactor metagenome]|uniref:Uncharacterized protein n=1 Tax=bioreactor metagenome TaxID=1076179 RepID=A0A644WQZ6_9ZZZZ